MISAAFESIMIRANQDAASDIEPTVHDEQDSKTNAFAFLFAHSFADRIVDRVAVLPWLW